MTETPAPPWRRSLAVQAAALQACWVAIRLMIGYRALDLGAGPVVLGLLAAAYAAPAVVMALPAGRLADRRGGIPLVLAGIAGMSGGSVLAAVSPGLVTLAVAGVVIGSGQLLIIVGQQSFVAQRSTPGRTDGAFGLLTSAVSIGQTVGPPGIAWISTTLAGAGPTNPDTTLGLSAAAALGVLMLPLVLRVGRRGSATAPPRADVPKSSLGTIVRTPGMWRALLVSGVVLTAMDLLYAFLPVWAVAQGVSVTTVGWLLALRAAVTVVSRVGLGTLVRRIGRKWLLLISLTLAAGGLTALGFVGAVGAVGVMVALGVGLGLPQPLTMSWVSDAAHPAHRGAALGLRITVNRLLQLSLPVAVGTLAGPLGVGAIFVAAAVLLGGMTLVVGSAGTVLDGNDRT